MLSAHPQIHPKYRPDIDGLRAIAVLSVIGFHAFPEWISGGFIGVDIFFVISGYLISTIIFENLDKGDFSFGDFYSRRICRIFPALILVLISCFVFGWFVLIADEYRRLGKHMAGGAGFVSNFIFWNEAGYFDVAADSKPLLHLWSLGIEEQFYIVWPIFLWFLWSSHSRLLKIIIVIAVLSFILNVKGVKHDGIAAFYSPLTRFWELLCGSILAWLLLYKSHEFSVIEKKFRSNILVDTISIAGLFGIALGFLIINKDASFPGKWALIPVISATLIIAAGPNAFINRTILSNKVIVWFGLISFPLYLWHWPLLSFTRIIGGKVPDPQMRIAAALLAVVLSWFTYKFIERPIRFGKINKFKVATLIILMIIIGYIGYNTYSRNGLSFRQADKSNINRLEWYAGKSGWLFLGGVYDNTTAKLRLSIIPTNEEIQSTKEIFSKIAFTAAQSNTKVVLFVAPNKSTIYSEFLPDGLVPSEKKYISFFLTQLEGIPNLIVYNPTNDLLRLKETEGILYSRTDTHWNNKGAYLAYSGFSELLSLPIPKVQFQPGSEHSGDLIEIARLNNFPLNSDDSWEVIWTRKPSWIEKKIPEEQNTSFGAPTFIANQNSLSNQSVWVIGDSFTGALRQYLNSTFKEVRYIGHWKEKLKGLSAELEKTEKKPDLIIIVKVERSF